MSTSPLVPAVDVYDAILVVGFGGPEGPADVLPFLEKLAELREIRMRNDGLVHRSLREKRFR